MYEELRAVAEESGVPQIRRHVFLCCDQTKPECCLKEQGLASWKYLKQRLLARSRHSDHAFAIKLKHHATSISHTTAIFGKR